MNDNKLSKVCAVIVTYNSNEKIKKVINSIINQVEEVIIVDNCSVESTKLILKEYEKNVKIIYNNENVGIARALNQGINYAIKNRYDWVLTLDHDSICDKDMIEEMLKLYEDYEFNDKIGIISPLIYDENKKDYIYMSFKERINKVEITKSKFDIVKGALQSGSLIKIEVFNKIGLFNEELFIYQVDNDFCERINRNNYLIIRNNELILSHEEGNKLEKKLFVIKYYYNNYGEIALYYITRNTIYMSKKYSLIYIKRVVKDFITVLMFDKKRTIKLKYMLKGFFDGIMNSYGKLK